MLHQRDRANVGAMAVASRAEATVESIAGCDVRLVSLDGVTVLAATPQEPMDRGGGVAQLLRESKLDSRRLIVLHDDADHLELGLLRVRTRGPAGGHAGLSSVMKALGTTEVTRLRIGVGRPGQDARTIPSVFMADELVKLTAIFEVVWVAIRMLARGEIEQAMSRYNRRDQTVDGRAAAPHRLPDGRIRGEAPPRGFRRPR